jgi:outer membrane protein insertion porin family
MTTGKLIVGLLFAICLVSVKITTAQNASTPQSGPSSTYKLLTIKVKGNDQYGQDQVIAASGLKLGQNVTTEDFQQATQRLADSGAFNDVVFSYQYSSQGAELDWQVAENNQLVPVRFDNLVWFSDGELDQLLRERIPLFRGKLPTGGSLADQLLAALQPAVQGKNVNAKINYLPVAPQDGGAIEAFAFRVQGLPISIHKIGFPGAQPAELPFLQASAKNLEGQEYSRTTVAAHEKLDFLPIYLQRGYLKASFGTSQAAIDGDSPQRVSVNVDCPAVPGLQYKLAAVQWSGNLAFPDEKLRTFLHLQTGQPVNAVELQNDVEIIRKLYGTRGYLRATVRTKPVMDDAQSSVNYQIEVLEGEMYRMGNLDIRGLDGKNNAILVKNWKMKTGEPYDSGYAKEFLAHPQIGTSLAGQWRVTHSEAVNDKSKTVDLILNFVPAP